MKSITQILSHKPDLLNHMYKNGSPQLRAYMEEEIAFDNKVQPLISKAQLKIADQIEREAFGVNEKKPWE